MNISLRLKILSTVGFRRIAGTFLVWFGGGWLLLEPAGLFFPNKLEFGWQGYISLVLLSLLGTIATRWPHIVIANKLSSPDSLVELKIGDLFEESAHLVIGTNDVFDTELGDVIKPGSVQGQFLTRVYQDDCTKLDTDIETALSVLQCQKTEDLDKKMGKRIRYPVGTTIALGSVEQRYFLTAYGRMGNDLKCESDSDALWFALSTLWEAVRLKGQGMPIAIPIVGSDLARTNLPRMTLIRLILLSFVVASKNEYVSQKLTVVIHPKDLGTLNYYSLQDCLMSACF